MEYLCTSCGTRFTGDGDLRCPSCLRKNGILPFDEARQRNSKGRRRLYLVEALVTAVLGTAVGLFLILSDKGGDAAKKKQHSAGSLPTSAVVSGWLKEQGLLVNHVADYFPGSTVFREQCAHLKTVEQVVNYVRSFGPRRGASRMAPRSPASLLAQNSHKTGLTAFEAILVAGGLNDACGLGGRLVEITKLSGSAPSTLPWEGAYGLAPGTGDTPPLVLGSISGEASRFRELDHREIAGMLLALRAWARVGGDPLAFDFLYHPEGAAVAAAAGQEAMALFRVARALAPKSPVVFAAGAWIHLRLGLKKPAARLVETLLSLTDNPEAMAFAGSVRLVTGDVKGARAALEQSSRRWLPVKILATVMDGGHAAADPMVALLSDVDGEAGDYVRLFFHSTDGRPSSRAKAVALAESILQKRPGHRWVVSMLFGLYVQQKRYPDARALVPAMTRGLKDAEKRAKALAGELDRLEKGASQPLAPVPPVKQ